MKTNTHTSPRFGCGELTHVEGTIDIKVPCGDKLSYLNGKSEIYYCRKCNNLIAAAPDMLEALKEIFNSVHTGKAVLESNAQLLKVKQAIAKAETRPE